MNKPQLDTEEVELFRVYKKNGKYHATDTRDVEDAYGLYGFLRIVLEDMENDLWENLGRFDADDN